MKTVVPSSSVAAEMAWRPPLRIELFWAALLLLLALAARLAFLRAYPTLPVSDFQGVTNYALAFRDQGLTHPGYAWTRFNVGPALALSVLLRLFPDDPVVTARAATAVWTGVTALLPFAIWRGVLPLWVRVLAGGLLALWPGQVFFSGVVAQDNWVIPPAVALAALAARALLARGPGHPVAGGLVFALAVAMRQEMMYVLLPLLFAAAGFGARRGRTWRNLAACALAVGLPFVAMAIQRGKATGEYALSSGHLGITLLGTVVPGAASHWNDPTPYLAAADPSLIRDAPRAKEESLKLALQEIRRRPSFHALRTLAAGLRAPFITDSGNLYWSVRAPGTLAQPLQPAGQAFAARTGRLLLTEMLILQGFFLAAVAVGLWRRSPAVLVIALAALLKIGLHAVVVAGTRFFTPAIALQIVVVALGAWEASKAPRLRVAALLAVGFAAALGLSSAGEKLYKTVLSQDPVEQRIYRFTLVDRSGRGELACVIRQGRVTTVAPNFAAMAPLPASGPTAEADCVLAGSSGSGALALQISGPHEVEIDGRDASSAEPGGSIPLGTVDPQVRRPVRIEASGPISLHLEPL